MSNAPEFRSDRSHAELKRIFAEARELPRERRDAFIDAACRGDGPLIARVHALLALSEPDSSSGFMESPTNGGAFATAHAAPAGHAGGPPSPLGALDDRPLAEAPGTILGPYKLLQKIGEGGFGAVFMAEQDVPVRRRVALKIIKLGMDTRQVVARFEQERQALAMMDHPHIAKVLDAGATATGRPYFVMELCKGDPITQFCDANGLTVRERLELVAQVCRAVQHAHQKGILHRDLKPSNILVAVQDGRPFAKVIDFGIAKATSARLIERTLFTEHRQLIGTPEYMSPEQAEGSLDIDTRTDVYSLGVLLYELLTGSTPFDAKRLRSAAFAELQRIIREVEPPAPSTRLSESRELLAGVALRRSSEPRKLGAIVRGELDWIVMKALEKDRKRRYDSASALAEDIGRFLEGEPVEAAPASRGYRLRKFVARHRGPVVAVGLVGAALVAGVVGTGLGLLSADRQRREAVVARGEAEIITRFLSNMLDAPTPDGRGRDVSMRSVLDEASGTIAGELAGFPIAEANLRRTIGNAYRSLGELDRASDHLLEAMRIRERILGGDHADAVRAKGDLAGLRQQQGRYDEAERLGLEALRSWKGSADDPLVIGIRNNLAQTLARLGRPKEAVAMQREVVEAMRRAKGPTHEDTIGTSVNYAMMLERGGDLAEAERILKRVIADAQDAHGEDDPTTLFARSELASFYLSEGRPAEAEPILRDTLERRTRVLGAAHADVGRTMANLGLVLARLGREAEALATLERAWTTVERALGPTHHDTLETAINMLERLEAADWPEALVARVPGVIAAVKTIAAQERVPDETLNTCAWYLLTVKPASLQDAPLALEAARRCVSQARSARNPSLWSYLDTYAMALARSGDRAQAASIQREAIQLLPADSESFRGEMTGRLTEYEAGSDPSR